MNRRFQLVIVICASVSFASILSHSLIAWLKIGTSFGKYWIVGPEESELSAFMAGSSLAGDGFSWRRISAVLSMRIEGWGVAGSSPSEWELFQDLSTQAGLSIFVVSAYDLNDHFISDFLSEVVPLKQTIRDLWQSRADWSHSKRLLSLYALSHIRILFPTAGRSDGVMEGVREEMKYIVSSILPMKSEAVPTQSLIDANKAEQKRLEKISDWSPGRMLRRLAVMRSACQGRHAFRGPKKLALFRMLRQAQDQGRVFVVVLPVSPAYVKEFLTTEVKREFDKTLTEAHNMVPRARWLRLDQLRDLNSNDYFWDLVHMNTKGQEIATEALLGQLRDTTSLP